MPLLDPNSLGDFPKSMIWLYLRWFAQEKFWMRMKYVCQVSSPELKVGSYNVLRAPRILNQMKKNHYLPYFRFHHEQFITYRLRYRWRTMVLQRLVHHPPVRLELGLHINSKHFAPKWWVLNSTKKHKEDILSIKSIFLSEMLTINGKANKWIVRLIPTSWLMTKTANVPKKAPAFTSDTTQDASSNVKGPVVNVLFLSWRSMK